jgi:hypothetical protein
MVHVKVSQTYLNNAVFKVPTDVSDHFNESFVWLHLSSQVRKRFCLPACVAACMLASQHVCLPYSMSSCKGAVRGNHVFDGSWIQ